MPFPPLLQVVAIKYGGIENIVSIKKDRPQKTGWPPFSARGEGLMALASVGLLVGGMGWEYQEYILYLAWTFGDLHVML